MKKLAKFFAISLLLSLVVFSCNKDEPVQPTPSDRDEKETGILKLTLSAISIEESSARVKEINTDDFIVKIYKVGEAVPVETYDPWSSAPDEIVLETGEYYVEAQNIDPPLPAEFEQPWYYGISENFTIDKEELKTITVEATLANYKVAFVYSDNVFNNFTWSAKATRVISGEFLEWPKDDDREGYFLIGEDLSIEVHLEYQKAFEPGVISRDFFVTIVEPNAATLYRVNIDAVLQDGKIQIGINVDVGFEIIDINPIASVTFSGPGTIDERKAEQL